jgi:putative addiction module antidote
MIELKIRKFGNSLGVILPKEVIKRLHAKDGERLFLMESSDDTYRLSPHDPGFKRKMELAGDIIDRYRETLRVLSE